MAAGKTGCMIWQLNAKVRKLKVRRTLCVKIFIGNLNMLTEFAKMRNLHIKNAVFCKRKSKKWAGKRRLNNLYSTSWITYFIPSFLPVFPLKPIYNVPYSLLQYFILQLFFVGHLFTVALALAMSYRICFVQLLLCLLSFLALYCPCTTPLNNALGALRVSWINK